MNKVILLGRLVKDCEGAEVGKDKTPKVTFTLAVDDGFGDNKKTNFIKCELWGKRGESLFEYLVKGQQVSLIGKLVTGNYENKEKKKVYFTNVKVEDIQLLQKPKDKQEPEKDDKIEGNRFKR